MEFQRKITQNSILIKNDQPANSIVNASVWITFSHQLRQINQANEHSTHRSIRSNVSKDQLQLNWVEIQRMW